MLNVQTLALRRCSGCRELLKECNGLARELLRPTNIDKELFEYNLLALLSDTLKLAVELVVGLPLGRFPVAFLNIDVDLLINHDALLVKILIASS